MGDATKIQWTDASWNPVRGCTRVSEGCRNCYAEAVAARFSGPGQPYEGLATRSPARWTGKVQLVEKHLGDPLRWQRPRRVFVNSMSDLFHESLDFRAIARVFGAMHSAPAHTFQVLTKRPERMHEFLLWFRDPGGWGVGSAWPREYGHVWLGVSVEDQETADERIPVLLDTPAAVRFVSAEPLLGPVDLIGKDEQGSALHAFEDSPRLDWVIVGGESGQGARPCDVAWIRSIVEQCRWAGVPVFVKQLGAHPEVPQGCGDCDPCIAGQPCTLAYPIRLALRDRKGGEPAEWPKDLRVREFPVGGV